MSDFAPHPLEARMLGVSFNEHESQTVSRGFRL